MSELGEEMAEYAQHDENATNQNAQQRPADGPRVWATEELFGEERLVLIRHGSETYQLRITKQNKLLLQK